MAGLAQVFFLKPDLLMAGATCSPDIRLERFPSYDLFAIAFADATLAQSPPLMEMQTTSIDAPSRILSGSETTRPPNKFPTILLVDENVADIYLIRRQLEADGVKNPVISVRSVGEAIVLLEGATRNPTTHALPCVMFTNLKLFPSDGFELIQWVKSQRPLDAMMVIVLTGSTDPAMMREAAEVGAEYYLLKFPAPGVFASIVAHAVAYLPNPVGDKAGAEVLIIHRILLIEDDEPLRAIIQKSLEQAGYVVSTSADGRMGLRSFRAEPVDLVITDLVMPGHEGISFIIQLHDEFPKTPIIAISGSSGRSPEYLGLALKLGASISLAKPFTRDALLEAVHGLLCAA